MLIEEERERERERKRERGREINKSGEEELSCNIICFAITLFRGK